MGGSASPEEPGLRNCSQHTRHPAAGVCIITYTEGRLSSDTRVFKEAFSLRDAGYQVHLIAAKWSDVPASEQIDGVQVDRIPCDIKSLGKLPRIAGAVVLAPLLVVMLPYAVAFKKKYGTTMRVALNSSVGVLSRWVLLLVFWQRACKLARGGKYRVYHAHDLTALPLAWWLKRRRGGAVVYDCHELWLDRNTLRKHSRYNPERVLEWLLESFLIRRSDAVLVVSESIAGTLAARYKIRRPAVIFNTPYYTDTCSRDGLPDLRGKAGIADNKPIVLYTGLISFGRGLERLVEAVSSVPDCHLVLMGYDLGKGYGETIRSLAREHGVVDRLHFVDAVPFAEVPLWAAGADVAAVLIENTCLSYYYCMPNKIFEAMMAGVPVIASGFPDMRTLISERGIGLTVDPHSVADIAQAITALVRDEGTRAAMRNSALEAAKVYHWGEQSKKLLEVYHEIVPGACQEDSVCRAAR